MSITVSENPFVQSTDPEVFTRLPEVRTISELCRQISEYGAIPAIIHGKTYCFSDLDKRMGQFRFALQAAGIQRGAAVGILFPNSFDFAAAALAVMSYGAIAVLFPPQLEEKAICGICLKYHLAAILHAPGLESKTATARQAAENLCLISSAVLPDGRLPAAAVLPEDGAAVVFTAGTTGKNKGALLSHKALVTGMRNGCYGYGKALHQRYFLVLPLTHIFGLVRNLLTSLYTGSTLYICDNLKNMFREIPEFHPTIMVMVPALAELALNMTRMISPAVLGGSLQTIICGAAVVSPYLAEEYHRLGIRLLAGYGMTETANLVSGNPQTLEHPESVGFLYPGQEYRVVSGELWLRGDNLLTEYYCDPEETAAAFEDGYFKTGDLVRFDEDGRLYITGRSKEIIVLSTGENVSPEEIENKFGELDCVQASLVYLEKSGSQEHLVAEILPRMSAISQGKDPEAYCTAQVQKVNQTLYEYQRVSKIIIRKEDFDRSPSMKIKRPKTV